MLLNIEIEWLKFNYPDLYYVPEKNIILGELSFKMHYTNGSNSFIINPDESYENIIQDVYEIEIYFSKKDRLPLVKETGGKIEQIKEKWELSDLGDLHVNSNGTLCLCVKTEEQIREISFVKNEKCFKILYASENFTFFHSLNSFGVQTIISFLGKRPFKET